MSGDPCGNEDCGICYPFQRFRIETEYVARMKHTRTIKAATAEQALAIYNNGSSWPDEYNTHEVARLEETPTTVTMLTVENDPVFEIRERAECCWNRKPTAE